MTISSSHRRVATLLALLGGAAASVASVKLLLDTAQLRYKRDVYRMVYNDNLSLLEEIRAKSGVQNDSIHALVERSKNDTNAPYIVVSIPDHRLWYKQGHTVSFTAPIATASGKELVGGESGGHWRFETPRGRLVVQSKDENPAWIPPDWHYVEQAHKRGLGLTRMERGQTIVASGEVSYTVRGSDIVKRYPNGRIETLPPPSEGREIVVNGNILIPPFGTRQRRYLTTLGTRRLDLGNGYGIHGTDEPQSIGHSVSHGCIRMYNTDIEKLYPMVPVGTPVYIY